MTLGKRGSWPSSFVAGELYRRGRHSYFALGANCFFFFFFAPSYLQLRKQGVTNERRGNEIDHLTNNMSKRASSEKYREAVYFTSSRWTSRTEVSKLELEIE